MTHNKSSLKCSCAQWLRVKEAIILNLTPLQIELEQVNFLTKVLGYGGGIHCNDVFISTKGLAILIEFKPAKAVSTVNICVMLASKPNYRSFLSSILDQPI